MSKIATNVCIQYLGTFDLNDGPLRLNYVDSMSTVVHQGSSSYRAGSVIGNSTVTDGINEFNEKCAKLFEKKELDKEKDEELNALREELAHHDATIVEMSKYFITIDDQTPEKHGFARHMCRKRAACKLAIAIKELQHDIKIMPIRSVNEFKVWSKIRKLNVVLEESKLYGDVLEAAFKDECVELLETARRLVVGVKLLNNY